MRRFVKRFLITILLLGSFAAIFVYRAVSTLDVESITPDVSMIRGAGGNVGVLRTARGAVIVDSMTFVMQGRRIREAAERIAGPTQVVINTHYHQDHTHGNPGFAVGTHVVSTRRTRDYLLFFDDAYWQGERAQTLPNDTFDDQKELQFGDKTVRLYFAGPGHTGGDLVALFVEDRVLHAGDLFFNRRYPRVDLAAGGSMPAWVATLDRVLELPFDAVIPGHGPPSDRAGLRAYRDFLSDVWEQTSRAVAAGKTLEQTLAVVDPRYDDGYENGGVPLLREFDRDSVVSQAWEEASGTVSPQEVPSAPAP